MAVAVAVAATARAMRGIAQVGRKAEPKRVRTAKAAEYGAEHAVEQATQEAARWV